MKHETTLCGKSLVIERKYDITRAIPLLDLKISEHLEKCEDPEYINSQEAKIEFSEIKGVLKFLYVSGIVSKFEYEQTLKHITGWRIYND